MSEGSGNAGNSQQYAKEDVLNELMEQILSHELKPGQPLVERVLAERFQLSRTPIREVLRQLERNRLVEVHPNQGAFVRTQSPKDIQDLFQLRIAPEPVAAALAAENRPTRELREVQGAFREALENRTEDPEHLIGLGQSLHDAVIRWTGNHLLIDMYGQLRMQTRLVRNLVKSRPDLESRSFREHMALLDAIEARDAATARERMQAHLERTEADIVRWFRSS